MGNWTVGQRWFLAMGLLWLCILAHRDFSHGGPISAFIRGLSRAV